MKLGDLVRLKSGGPVMTVTNSYGGEVPVVICSWFTGGNCGVSNFPESAVDIVPDSDGDSSRSEYAAILDKVCSWPGSIRRQMIHFLDEYERQHP